MGHGMGHGKGHGRELPASGVGGRMPEARFAGPALGG